MQLLLSSTSQVATRQSGAPFMGGEAGAHQRSLLLTPQHGTPFWALAQKPEAAWRPPNWDSNALAGVNGGSGTGLSLGCTCGSH